ncbi:MAG: RsmB/NOP family class I SAM-dependent RNA methyltransferase [Synergistaceae bacterium]|nr:RsmB/NOP family class I SAM-dependent RNA methyltransferase [Synergistaceae bacterium]
MRGIEAALTVLTSELDKKPGKFSSESLRILADRERMKAPDISLASSLIYIVMRRKELWEKISSDYLRSKEKLPPAVNMAVLMGTGGLLELRRFSGGVLVNGIIEYLRRDKSTAKYAGLVNAVLHKVIENGAGILGKFRDSSSLDGRAMYAGIPLWTLPAWTRTWTRPELNAIFDMAGLPSYSALRVSPGKREEVSRILDAQEIRHSDSDMSPAIRLNESVMPARIPGFAEGLFTAQAEGSILAASLAGKFYGGGNILDMCSGRGVKAGQMLQECPSAKIECWEVSESRSKSAVRELERLGVISRAVLRAGNALSLVPENSPGFVVLDAPCSGSGTWNRKPESKWRLTWDKLDSLVMTQKRLLRRAVSLCESGGHILYITCSLLKQENESVVAEVLSANSDCAEISGLVDWRGEFFRRGKPYGIYILPGNSWLDGFYCSLILKRG